MNPPPPPAAPHPVLARALSSRINQSKVANTTANFAPVRVVSAEGVEIIDLSVQTLEGSHQLCCWTSSAH